MDRGQAIRSFVATVALLFVNQVAFPDSRVTSLEIHNPPTEHDNGISVTFMGTTTLFISDGETTLITDGYFTRASIDLSTGPGALVEPDRAAVESHIDALNIEKAAAVMVVHSHFDHSLDAPIVAELTGAHLLGSESTANIGRGLGLAEQQIRAVEPGEPMAYGKFSVTFFVSKHWPLPEPYASLMANATIDAPLVPPAPFEEYKEGKTYSILLEHPMGNMLIQGSAGYLPGALDSVDVDTVFLSIGGLGDLPPDEQENYYREIVTVTGARNIVPIHWDTAVTPLNEPLVPYDDFDRAITFLKKKRSDGGAPYALLPVGEPVLLDLKAID